jgi:cytochrome c553
LKDYKSGARPNSMKRGLTAALSDQDIEDLAAYYESLR